MSKAKYNPRKHMEKAIEMMRFSVEERRDDDKICPKVGAVLITPEGEIITAFRGELRAGDHAEFTLLERKSRDRRLDGSTLFATLEPCAPGSRRHPKLGCAERIVLARIAEVWIGIEDPDPMVDRKGIKYLQDNNITVHMFDRDLQEIIQDENAKFIEKALDRAAVAAERKHKTVTLSPLENEITFSDISDFSNEALDLFRSKTNISDEIGSEKFLHRLILLGLLKKNGTGKMTPSGFGLLLFGSEPRLSMQQAGLLGTIYYENGTEEINDFDGPQVFVPINAIKWIKDKLPDPIIRSQTTRKPLYDVFFELVREGIVNALIHRDYAIEQAKCQLIVTKESVVIKSPGTLQPPITLEQIQNFSAPMLSRNPVMHFVFSRLEFAEERGLGLRSMKAKALASGLPLPVYTWEDPYLFLTIYRSVEDAVDSLPKEKKKKLNNDDLSILKYIIGQESISSSELIDEFEFEERKVQRILKKLLDEDLINRIGKGPSTRYESKRI